VRHSEIERIETIAVCAITVHKKLNGSPCQDGAGTRVERARRPRSSSESVMDMSIYSPASSQWATQRRFEPPPCLGTSAANGVLRHRQASSIAPPLA
jgi:hypothetical protein